jgi:surfeit locus 1 family protein
MAFRPRPLPTLITAAALALLLGLGFWQLERLGWKRALIADLEARLEAPPVAAAELAGAAADALRYRRIELRGAPVAGPFYWSGRTRNGEVGADILALYAPVEGEALIVNRGWVPYGPDGKPVTFRPAPPGPVAGVVREAGWHGFEFLRPANDAVANAWLYVDPAAMAAAAGYAGPVNEAFYVGALPQADHSGPPLARTPEIDLPNNHLQYAITWFAVAAGVLVIYVLWHLRRGRSRETDAP